MKPTPDPEHSPPRGAVVHLADHGQGRRRAPFESKQKVYCGKRGYKWARDIGPSTCADCRKVRRIMRGALP